MAESERKIVLKLKCYTSSPRQRAAAYKFILDEMGVVSRMEEIG